MQVSSSVDPASANIEPRTVPEPRTTPEPGIITTQRRLADPMPWLSRAMTVLVAAFVLLAIGTPLLGLAVFAGTDIVMTKAPWNALVPTGFRAQNPYVGDTIDGLIPAAHAFAERLHDGDLAGWWSLNIGGSQLEASNALFSPLSAPYLFLPASLAPAYVKLLELVVTIGGMFLFLRQLSLVKAAALLGGVVFATSGFMVAWTNWPHTKVAAFIPALFWAVERLARNRRPTEVALVAVVVGSMLLGGFPAVTAYALVAAGAYLLVRLVTIDGRRLTRLVLAVGLGTAGALLGAAIAAMQIVPFVQELSEVAVGARDQSPESHSPMISMVTMLAPDAFGSTNPTGEAGSWYGLGHPIEELSYVGAAALLLVVVAIAARRRAGLPPFVRGFFVAAAAIAVVLVFFGGPLLTALQQLPVFDTNRIGRARSLVGFFLAVLAAIGLDALVRRPTAEPTSAWRRRVWAVVAAGTWIGAGAGAFLVVRSAHQYALGRERLDSFDGSVRWAATLGGLAVLAALAARYGPGWVRAVGLALVPLIVVGQGLSLVLAFWPRVPPSHFYPSTSTHEFLASHLGSDRMLSAGTMLTGTEAYYGLRTVGGRAFVAEEYDALLRAWCDSCFITPTYLAVPGDPSLFGAPLLDRLGARYIVTDPAAAVLGDVEVVGEAADALVLHPDVPVTLALPDGPLRAVGVEVAEPYATADPLAAIEVEVRDAAGATLLVTSRRLFGGAAPGVLVVALPEREATSAASAVVTLHADDAMSIRADGATPAAALVRPADDDVVVVHGGATTIYERQTALPRIRWAASMVVEPDPARVIDLVTSGRAPDVVLSAPAAEPAGAPAQVDVVEDSGDTIEVAVDAAGLGYLVVADGLQDRWTASVDGQPVPLLDADAGYVAIEVAAGVHSVRLTYDRPLSGGGYLLSAGAAVAAGALLLRGRRRPT